MTRYFRTVFATSLACLLITLLTVSITGTHMPFSAFACVLGGLLLYLLPAAAPKLAGKKTLFALLGAAAGLLGFLPILLTCAVLSHYIAYGLFLLSAVLFLITLRHNTTHNNFKARFGFLLIVILCVLFYFVMSSTTLRRMANTVYAKPLMDPESVKSALHDIVPLIIVLLASGVLCLRGLRAQNGAVDERSFQRRQLRDALIFLFSVSIVFITLPLLKPVWDLLVEYVLAPLGRLFMALLERAASGAKQPKMPLTGGSVVTASPTPAAEAPLETQMPYTSAAPIEGPPPPATILTGEYLYTLLALLAVAIVLTIAAVLLVKALRRLKKYEKSYPNESLEALPETDEPKKEEKPSRYSADPRKRMRYLYAEFLRCLRRVSFQRSGGPLNGDSTDPESIDAGSWGETSKGGRSWARARLNELPAHTALSTSQAVRDEGMRYDTAAAVMQLFDRKSPRRRGRFGRRDAEWKHIYKTSTCEEIRESAGALSRADASDLSAFTAYYERARYHMNEEPSAADAARMAELLGRIKPEL